MISTSVDGAPMRPEVRDFLLRHARSLIDSGALPFCERSKVLGGLGTESVACNLCGNPIQAAQVSFDVIQGSAELHFHRACFFAWESATIGVEGMTRS
jgi:hypothetical protein